MKELRSEIYDIEEREYDRANSENPMFHSKHEGFCILLEEFCEFVDDADILSEAVRDLWEGVYKDNRTEATAKQIEMIAIEAACEAVQVAAMARKYVESNNMVSGMNISPDLWELLKHNKDLRKMVKMTYKKGVENE